MYSLWIYSTTFYRWKETTNFNARLVQARVWAPPPGLYSSLKTRGLSRLGGQLPPPPAPLVLTPVIYIHWSHSRDLFIYKSISGIARIRQWTDIIHYITLMTSFAEYLLILILYHRMVSILWYNVITQQWQFIVKTIIGQEYHKQKLSIPCRFCIRWHPWDPQ